MSGANLMSPSRLAPAPILVQTKTNTFENENGASIAATFDTAPAENSLIVCRATFAARAATPSMNAPTGFSTAFNLLVTASADLDGVAACFYKIAGPSESATVTVTTTSDVRAMSIEIMEWSGLVPTSPLDVTATNDETGGTGLVANTGTTAVTARPVSLAVAVCCIGDDNFEDPESGDWLNSYTQSNTFFLNGAGGTDTDHTVGYAHKILSATGVQNTTLTFADGTAEERWSGIAIFKGVQLA